MSHPLDTDALYHCTCGEWHNKGTPCPRPRHVVIGRNVYHCLHCGAQYPLALPMTLNMMVATSRAFVLDHQDCLPPAARGATP